MVYEAHEIKHAEKLVAGRCESSVARFLDFCEASPGRPVLWESHQHPWSFRVTFISGKWVMDNIDEETEGMEDFFKDEDIASREGVDHVICSVLIPLAIDVALGNASETTTEEFLSDIEHADPRLDGEAVGPQ